MFSKNAFCSVACEEKNSTEKKKRRARLHATTNDVLWAEALDPPKMQAPGWTALSALWAVEPVPSEIESLQVLHSILDILSDMPRVRDRPVWHPDFIRKVSFSKVEMSRQCLKTCVVTER